MLVHQTHTSEGVVSSFVNITDRSISNVRITGTCHSGVRVGSGGVLFKIQANGGFSSISGEWLPVGTPAGFFVQRTILSGTLEVDAGAGFLQCNANRDYDNQKSSAGIKITSIFLEFSSDVSGVPIVGTATLTFTSDQGVRTK